MRYRPFGTTGWLVSEIGFGAWQLGGDWGSVDDAQSVRTLHHAFHRGINFVDTAQMYGKGHSETVVGRALKAWSGDKIYVATKVQPTQWPGVTEDDPQMRGRYPAWHLRASVEGSLARLGVERIDLLQLHCWMPDGVRALDWLEVLNDLRCEGKVDKIGVSLRDYRPADGVELAKLGLVSAMQVIFNLFEQRPADLLFNAGTAPAHIVRVPLDSGALTGSWTAASYGTWPQESVPARLFRGARFAETLERVEKLKSLCRPFFPTLAEAAMRFTLSPPRVSTVIPGMQTEEQVDANIAFSDGAAFPADLLAQVSQHGWPRNYYQ
ncbi:aldo/keto reductase [Stagnihabitans tardus]|uniref:Aldo/keto reductase n=1 Tax=Stagnihabitans tardus TaxID=2699202 RepID=A0AAE4YBW0_9RHOB|nr:aldo/keto reductase [Stagnihabitans tardus]NBZ89806.1 aldo/keto reductase [Stagnihabitans tardus]